MFDLDKLPGASHENEQRVHILRRHPITLLPLFITVVILLALPPILLLTLPFLIPDLLQKEGIYPLIVIGITGFFLFGWLFTFQQFTEYWLDVCILTDKRIIDIDQSGLFGRTISELRLYRTQDVTAEIKGFWKTMLDYGDIFIQTAGETDRFIFEDVPHPNQITQEILELAEKDRQGHLEEAIQEVSSDKKPTTEKVAQKIEP